MTLDDIELIALDNTDWINHAIERGIMEITEGNSVSLTDKYRTTALEFILKTAETGGLNQLDEITMIMGSLYHFFGASTELEITGLTQLIFAHFEANKRQDEMGRTRGVI